MNYQNILVSTNEDYGQITINRQEKLNALNKETLDELLHAVSDLEKNSSLSAIIITGSGPKAFVAGADISEFLSYNSEQGKELAMHGHRVFNVIENCSKPVIAAINGFALGGGCELAMACHLRIASSNAKFGQPEVNLGLIPGYGGTQRLVRLIGKTKAMELLITADMISASEALQLGLINHMTEPEGLLPKCVEIIQKIKTKSPMAIAEVIHCVNAFSEPGVSGLYVEIERFGSCFGKPEFQEGVSAFLEKRKANFRK